jgi:hypothetical protein
LAKDSGKQKEKVQQSFSLSEITIFLLSVSVSFFLSFFCLVAFDDFFLGLRERERERGDE